MKKLISMVEFVLEVENSQEKKEWSSESDEWFNRCFRYADFLKTPLEAWMFIAMWDDGSIVEEMPENYKENDLIDAVIGIRNDDAKGRVLFEGFEVVKDEFIGKNHFYIQKQNLKIMWNFNDTWVFYEEFKTIEDLVKYNPTLTESAIKKLGV